MEIFRHELFSAALSMSSSALLGTDPLGNYGSCMQNPGDGNTSDSPLMSTRVGYIGLSPTSALPPTSDGTFRRQPLIQDQSSVQRFWSNNKEIFEENHGLFLVIGSQAFLSMVNIVVKQLNSIDPPVSVLEVRASQARP